MVKLQVFLLALVMILGLVTFPVLAADVDFGSSRINPASPLYFLKTIREGFEMHLAQTGRVKTIRQLEFATRRLREVNSLISTNRQDLIEATLIRYWSHIQNLPEQETEPDIADRIRENLKIDLQFLNRSYDQLLDPRARMAVRATINKLVQRRDLENDARSSGCSFLTKVASSSALTEVERAIYGQRAQRCAILLSP